MNKIPAGYKKTEVGIIPEDWVIKPLGDVLKIKHGKSQKGVSDKNGSYPILASGGVIGMANKFIYNKPSVLIGRKGTIDAPQYMETPFWSVDTLFYSEIFDGNYPKFLFYKFLLVDWYAHNEASGVPSLNAKTIEQISVSMPPKRSEQIAIATALNDADALITQLEKLIAKKRLIKQGAMQQLLTGKKRLAGFDRHPDGRPKGHKQTELGSIPEDWVIRELGDMALFRRGSFPQPYGLPKWYDQQNGMPFVQVFDVDVNMKLKPDTKQRISDAAKDRSVFVEKNSIVLTIQGSIGRIALTQYDAYVDRTLLIFSSYLIPLDKIYFMYSVYQLFQVEKQKAPGGTIKTITKEELKNFKIASPPTKTEQTAIAQTISDMDIELDALEARLAKYKQIKLGMMQSLLTGKVRLI